MEITGIGNNCPASPPLAPLEISVRPVRATHASESQSFQAFLWHKKLPSISFQTANASSFQAGPGILIKKTLSAPGKVLVLF